MIGKAYKLGTGFKALAAYLEYGRRDGTERDRVDWVETRNLPTEHPQAAARIMVATAHDSDSVQPPVYHFSVSFDPDDPLNRDTMRQVADRTLRGLGLQDHQVLIVAHRDRAHAHLHFMVNRVHPEKRTVWSNWNDYARIEKAMREQEAELGLRIVPGKHAAVPEHARDRAPRQPAPRLARGDSAFVERVQREARPHLMAARSWVELERALGQHGLSVRTEGRGMVVTDGVHKVKCSEIDPAASRANLERRLGGPLGEYRARQAVAGRTLDERAARVESASQLAAPKAPPIPAPETRARAARSVPPLDEGRAAPARPSLAPSRPPTPAPAERSPAAAPAPQLPRRPRTYTETGRDFAQHVRALYADPAAARRAFLDAAERRGPERAAASLRQQPEHFGALRPGADPARRASAALAGYEYTRHRAARLRPALLQAAQLLRDSARAGPHGAGDLREAAAVLASAQIGRAVDGDQLVRRLAPMLPRSAAGLARQAVRIGLELVREQEQERGRERERGLSL
ncbi:MAG TPA: relaxase/mobilization nuclease domain-containing protein [Longimicrobium sp.]